MVTLWQVVARHRVAWHELPFYAVGVSNADLHVRPAANTGTGKDGCAFRKEAPNGVEPCCGYAIVEGVEVLNNGAIKPPKRLAVAAPRIRRQLNPRLLILGLHNLILSGQDVGVLRVGQVQTSPQVDDGTYD